MGGLIHRASATGVLLAAIASQGCGPGQVACEPGFAPEGERCADLDECLGEGGGHDCAAEAECTNTDGGFSCACSAGYEGDGYACADLDECAGEGGGHDCHEHALCTNTAGGFDCTCDEGYEGDGQSCERRRGAALVILNGTVIDGTGAPPAAETAVVIVEGRVAAVGPSATLFLYPDDEVLDVAGRFVMPGVVNAHVHQADSAVALEAWAQAGVTTVREVGAPLYPPEEWTDVGDWDEWVGAVLAGTPVEELLPSKFVLRDGEAPRPESARLLASGPCITATNGYPAGPLSLHVNTETVVEGDVEITPVEDARRKTEVLVDAGADVIKICLDDHWGTTDWGLLTEEQIGAIVEVAHSGGVRVTAHVSADAQLSTVLAAEPPVDGAAHIVTDRMSDENIAAMVDQGTILVPTLAVWESLSWICTDFGMCEESDNLRRFVEAGGRVALGDDFGNVGIPLDMPMRDFELMVEAGMTTMEVLVAATAEAAFDCGLGDELGTIEEGRLADLIVLDDDPLVDLAALDEVAWVIREGVIIRAP